MSTEFSKVQDDFDCAPISGVVVPRILIVAPSFDILGGQSVQAARLISRLRETTSSEIGFLPINPRLPGVLHKLQAIKYLRTIVTSLLYVGNLIAQVPKFDVIHIFSASYFSFVLAQTPAILISKLFRKRVLLNYHSGEAEDHLKRWPSAVRTIRLADSVVVPSEYLVNIFAQFGIEARAINNLIELENFAFRERREVRPLFLANRNLERHYGVDSVLRAFAIIQRTYPDAQLIVAGEGSQRASLESLARDLDLRNTEFVGRIDPGTIVEYYNRSDIYLNGSHIDNQPLSILEAFASGLPVVTTNAGGIPNMVKDRVTGFLVDQGDHSAMAERALQLLNEPDCATRLTREGLRECRKYTWPVVGPGWMAVYAALARKDRGHEHGPERRRAKLRAMSFREASFRISQHLHQLVERHGWNRLPSDKKLQSEFRVVPRTTSVDWSEQALNSFRQSKEPKFFSSFETPESTVAALRRHCPESDRQIIDSGERIIAGEFDLLGHRGLKFGSPIDWRLDPTSGKKTPLVHWSRIDYLNPDVAGDKKVTWELNRHQYFVRLGQAYWLTKDERYARCFFQHLKSWMDANPPKMGINWASSLEIALRSIAWLWVFHFFKDSPSFTPSIFNHALKFLYLNAKHLEKYLSTYFSPNTHLTGEALGLFYLGTLLPQFREADTWRSTGKKILVEQLQRQVRADGVYFEQSSYYHRYTADFYTHFLILSQLNHEPLDPTVERKFKLLLDHLMYLTRPDGSTPIFGDDDGGRLISLDCRAANDFRAALSTGAALFKRGDYKFVADGFAEETLWLLGIDGLANHAATNAVEPTDASRAFPDGGYYVMRDRWHRDANYLLFDCGPHGTMNGGHAHADALAIEVTAKGLPTLVDCGTYTYTGSREHRNAFRDSASHNVLIIDGQPSSVPGGPFSWKSTANSWTNAWVSERRFDFVEGCHDGYQRLSDPAIHRRGILFLKNDYWVVRDTITSSGRHDLQLRFHFPSTIQTKLTTTADRQRNTPETLTATSGPDSLDLVAVSQGTWAREEGWISHCYGHKEAAPVWTFSSVSQGNTEIATLLMPNTGVSKERARIREVEAIGGRAFEVVKDDQRDVVLLRDAHARRIQTVRLVSDFNWTWMRFSGSDSELPQELVVLDGHYLELDGKEILTSAKPLHYLVASRHGNKFRLETTEGVIDFAFPIVDLDAMFAGSSSQAS